MNSSNKALWAVYQFLVLYSLEAHYKSILYLKLIYSDSFIHSFVDVFKIYNELSKEIFTIKNIEVQTFFKK